MMFYKFKITQIMETSIKDLLRESISNRLVELEASADLLDILTMKVTTMIMALAYNHGDVQAATQDLWEIPTQTVGETPEKIAWTLDGIAKQFPKQVSAYTIYLDRQEQEDEETRLLVEAALQ
jgi:hypothetical protein